LASTSASNDTHSTTTSQPEKIVGRTCGAHAEFGGQQIGLVLGAVTDDGEHAARVQVPCQRRAHRAQPMKPTLKMLLLLLAVCIGQAFHS
jgi:hypothetical protein